MKKALSKLIVTFSVAIIAVVFFVMPTQTQAQTVLSESITNYVTDITINQDSSINVVETINYDFGLAQKHGIFRNIPYKYKARGGTFTLRIGDISVTNEAGESIPFSDSKSGGDVVLKIGDPDVVITGAHTYKISYSVTRAVNYFADHDELYWNAIGTGWEVPITKSEAVIHAPIAITQTACFTGGEGSQAKDCSISGGNTETVNFITNKVLSEGEGLTIVVGLPANTLTKPTTTQKFLYILRDNGILLLPLAVFLFMFYLWNKYGKDPKRKNPIVAQYDAPAKMSALYLGSLLHGKTKDQDIAAEVVYLAAHGFMTIQKIETKKMVVFKDSSYEFTKLEKSTDELTSQTKKLLDVMFDGKTSVKLSDLKTDVSFGTALVEIKSKVMKELEQDGYYRAKASLVAGFSVALGFIVGIGGSVLLGNTIGYLGVISAIISALIIITFSFIMPSRTQKGADTVAHIKGLEEYLTVAEKDRLKFHNAPEKNPQHFELLLPFAIALGVEAAWASQFKDLTKAPSWYSDTTGNTAIFNVATFSHSMSNFSNSVQSVSHVVTTASRGGSGFSGGGFSGGGGGGGGGGSW